MIIVNTGNGKGKTTAAIGQIIRSLGRGWNVCLIQLFKGEEFYGEQKILKILKNLDFFSFAPRHPFCFPKTDPAKVKKECEKALRLAKRKMAGGKYQLIVLEEFNIALREGYLKVKPFLEVLDEYHNMTNIIVTGRCAPKQLIDKADIVTEMLEIKHGYASGTKAAKGIEY